MPPRAVGGSSCRLNIANLAGVPSIVYGILGLALFVRALALQRSILAGALTLTLVVLPIVILAAQESLRAVPDSIRRASYALGATRWQTMWYQVLPAATPGIMTGVILAISRALGEAAPLVAIGAATFITFVPISPTDEFSALPVADFRLDEPPAGRLPSCCGRGDRGAVDRVDPAQCDGCVTCGIDTESEFVGKYLGTTRSRLLIRRRRGWIGPANQASCSYDGNCQPNDIPCLSDPWFHAIDQRERRTIWPVARRRSRSIISTSYYGEKQALSDVSLLIPQNCVTAFIGPSGCGKSTFLRCLNRMNDMIDGTRVEGEDPARWARHLRPEGGRRRTAQARRHGVSEVESVSQVDLRERGVRAAGGGRAAEGGAGRNRGEVAHAGRRCGMK